MAFSSVPTGLSALPAPLHSDALPLVGLDCTGEHVKLVSEHSSFCLGNDTLRKHLHENAIKSLLLFLRDGGRKCSVRATWCGMDRDGGEYAICILHVTHHTFIISALSFKLNVFAWWNTSKTTHTFYSKTPNIIVSWEIWYITGLSDYCFYYLDPESAFLVI